MDKLTSAQVITELRTIQDFVRFAVSEFNQSDIYYGHGTDNSWDEAIRLVLPSLYLPLAIPSEFYHANLTTNEKKRILENIEARIDNRIPTPYLTKRAWFCGHEFYVDERVLIPRSPLCELIKNHFEGVINFDPDYILDLCTGSGCIGIACAYEFPDAEVDIADISTEALAVAEINIEMHQLQKQVLPICSDLFNDIPPVQYDLMISNPPYVDAEDFADMPTEFLQEPKLALAAGKDGLKLIRQILDKAADYLSDRGVLVCEVGNSVAALTQCYPNVKFKWLSFNNGGEGVFMLTKQQLQDLKSAGSSK